MVVKPLLVRFLFQNGEVRCDRKRCPRSLCNSIAHQMKRGEYVTDVDDCCTAQCRRARRHHRNNPASRHSVTPRELSWVWSFCEKSSPVYEEPCHVPCHHRRVMIKPSRRSFVPLFVSRVSRATEENLQSERKSNILLYMRISRLWELD